MTNPAAVLHSSINNLRTTPFMGLPTRGFYCRQNHCKVSLLSIKPRKGASPGMVNCTRQLKADMPGTCSVRHPDGSTANPRRTSDEGK